MNNTNSLRYQLDNIINLSMQVGALQAQLTYKMYGPVLEIITDATHWMIVKGPKQ